MPEETVNGHHRTKYKACRGIRGKLIRVISGSSGKSFAFPGIVAEMLSVPGMRVVKQIWGRGIKLWRRGIYMLQGEHRGAFKKK